MKKLFIIFFVFLFSTHTQALVFEKCYDAKPFDISKVPFEVAYNSASSVKLPTNETKTLEEYKLEAFYKYKKRYNKKLFRSDIYETWQYKLLPKSKLIQTTYVVTDKDLIKSRELSKEFNVKLNSDKITKFNYKIYSVTEKYIEARSSGTGSYIRLNLKSGTVMLSENSEFTKDLYLFHCSFKDKNKHYLDYWWAVILIIAITFFIFTQSGNRLKQVRRK